MAEIISAKKPGDLVRVLRQTNNEQVIENDWSFVRFEPDSGNLVAEKNGKRVVSPRAEYDALNFSGAEAVWEILTAGASDPDLLKARSAWTKLDLSGMTRALLGYARTCDPALVGVQTVSDLTTKVRELNDSCINAMELLRLDMKRAEAEYNRAPMGASLENDQKDNLLERWHSLQDRYAARAHLHEKMIPIMCRLGAALMSIEAAAQKSR